MKADDAVIMRLSFSQTPEETSAAWDRPQHFQTDGETFSRLSGPAIHLETHDLKFEGEALDLTFAGGPADDEPDRLLARCTAAGKIEISYTGASLPAFVFNRSTSPFESLGPFDPNRTYVRAIERPTNEEMTAIFDMDQAARKSADIDWSVVAAADDARRKRTGELLEQGALQSGDDYYHAAFVFQHGSSPDDYLKAHTLAMIAIARGKPGAIWIAAATLDRYLKSTGRSQIYGTQFTLGKDTPATQEPYNRDLISDEMRRALHVPSLQEQEQQRQRLSDPAPPSAHP